MNVTENSPTNVIDINDEESVDVSMGIDAANTENTDEKELSPTKKKDFDNSYKNGPSTSRKNELHKYLDEERLDRKQDMDVLSWWQMEHFHYPILSNLARDVLTIPISTVALESAFSIGGKVLDQYRTLLLP
ncbi:hypothetical protein ACE6H2_024883 [Prunus campanulata]